jgi:hypothetical protein
MPRVLFHLCQKKGARGPVMDISYYNIPNSSSLTTVVPHRDHIDLVLTRTGVWENSSFLCHHLVFLLQLRDQIGFINMTS